MKINDTWCVYAIDNETFRVERDFGLVGEHSLILTATNHCRVPFVVRLLHSVLVFCIAFICMLMIFFGVLEWHSNGMVFTTGLTLIVAVITTGLTLIVAVILRRAYLIRKKRKAFVSFFTFDWSIFN
jgi:uncharacterized membrane protein